MHGSTLGPYRSDRELGSGGMGRVYAAEVARRDFGMEVGTVVALKRLPDEAMTHWRAADRASATANLQLHREIAAAAKEAGL